MAAAAPTLQPSMSSWPPVGSPLQSLDQGVWRVLVKEAGLQTYLQDLVLTRGIHKKVDVSEDAMTKMFDLLDREEVGFLTRGQFVEGLNRCLHAFGGTPLPKDLPAIEEVWEAATATDSGEPALSREAFAAVIRRLKMEVLLPPSQSDVGSMKQDVSAPSLADGAGAAAESEEVDMKVFDFDKRQMHVTDVSAGRLRDFFLGRKVRDTILKWIMVECHDHANVLRLAVKYRIHALHLEDLLKLETQKAKVTTHGGNHFCVIPILRLARETDRALQAWREAHRDDVGGVDQFGRRRAPFPIHLEEATAGVFSATAAATAPPNAGGAGSGGETVITIRTTWRPVNNKTGQVNIAMRKEFRAEPSSMLSFASLLRADSASSKQHQHQHQHASGASSAVATPTTGGTASTAATGTASASSGGDPTATLRTTTRRRDMMLAMRQSLRHGGGGSSRFSLTTAAAAMATTGGSSSSRKPLMRRGPSGRSHSQRASGGGGSTKVLPASMGGIGRASSMLLKDILSPRRPPQSARAGGRAPSQRAQATAAAAAATAAAAADKQKKKGGGKGKAEDEEQEEERRRRQAADAEEWGELFDDDGGSMTSELEEEDDWYFDAQMMHEVAESVYMTNAAISGNTAQWLLHSILDHTVDRLLPIVEAYQLRVSYFQDELHRRGADFGKTCTAEVMDAKLDLVWIQRRVALLKPILRHLLRTAPADLQLYYQDIDDHLDRCLEGLSGLTNTAQSIIEEAHHHREERINEILFAITILTSIFTPANFIAGVFGMNFTLPDGSGPGMPELTWKHGYLWFWLWSFLLSGAVFALVQGKFSFRTRMWR